MIKVTFHERKDVIGGYDFRGNAYPTQITRKATLTVVNFFDAGENAKGIYYYLEAEPDPRFD